MRRISVLVMATCLGATAPSTAQEAQPAGGAPMRLTLEEAIGRGLTSSHRLAELAARDEGAEAAESGRRAAGLPLVSLAGGYTRTNHVDAFGIAVPGMPLRTIYPDIPDNARARLDLQWPVYTGGRLEALARAARADRGAAAEDLAAARADLRLEITRAFWALLTARETETVVGASLRSMDAHVGDLRSRLEQGLIPPNDVLSAEAQQSRARLLAIEASTLAGVADADLRRLAGMEGEGAIQPAADLAPPVSASDPDATRVAPGADARPERRALSSRVAAFRARSDAAAASGRPQVGVGAGYDYARPNPRIFPRIGEWRASWDVSLNVSWLVFDGGRRRAEVAEALAGVRGAEARAAEFDRQRTFEVRQRHLERDASRMAVQTADAGVASATEARRVVGERFAAGVAINTEVLDAELALLQARLDRTRALANARLADARLLRAVGE